MRALPLRESGAFVLTGAVAAAACFALLGYPASLLGAAFAPLVAIIVRSDLENFRIPDAANALAAALGLLGAALEGAETAAFALVRAAAAFAAFYLVRWLYWRLRGAHGLGLGDVKLAGVGGLWLGLADLALAVDLACVAILGYLFARRWAWGEPLDPRRRLPFGAALAPAIFLAWFLRSLAR